MMDQLAKAKAFQQFHQGPRILIIANAWDAASARVFEHAGMRAIGTGSAGVAFSHGYPDNERIPRDVILAATREIVGAVQSGTYTRFHSDAIPYPEANKLFE